MKSGRKLLALLLAAGMSTAAMTAAAADGQADKQQLIARMAVDYKDYLGLTQEQRLEDYDYLWNTLETSYPYWGVVERRGVDLAALKAENRARIEREQSDFTLASAVETTLFGIGQEGHLMFFDTAAFDSFRESYANIRAIYGDEFSETRAPWYDALEDETTIDQYRKTGEVFDTLYEALGVNTGAAQEGSAQTENIGATILPGGILYIKIDQFLNDLTADRKVLLNLYERAHRLGCRDLIFDLTDNGGGDTNYWNELIAAPNIAEPITWGGTLVFRDSVHNRPYLEALGAFEEAKPIAQLPDLPRMEREDRARMTHFVTSTQTIEPRTPGKKMFEGDIWVLTSPSVYSASENFSLFCKRTGFATLVGSRTGGDGLGVDPVFCTLPNSRLLFRYSMFGGLNSDGSDNEEWGTSPDITKKTSETALDACLRAIANRRAENEKGRD